MSQRREWVQAESPFTKAQVEERRILQSLFQVDLVRDRFPVAHEEETPADDPASFSVPVPPAKNRGRLVRGMTASSASRKRPSGTHC